MAEAIVEREVVEISDIELRLARARSSASVVDVSVRAADDKSTPSAPFNWVRLVSADIKYLSGIVAQLVELRSGPEHDDYGVLRPTEIAFHQACSLLVDTAIVAALQSRIIPHGCASTDSEGGIRIEWVGSKCSVHLVVPANPKTKSYVYHERGNEYGSTDCVTPETLASRLHDFMKCQ